MGHGRFSFPMLIAFLSLLPAFNSPHQVGESSVQIGELLDAPRQLPAQT
jgi:hypothetical protein